MEINPELVTRTGVDPLSPAEAAWISLVPGATPFTEPVAFTVATAGFRLVQPTAPVTGWVVPLSMTRTAEYGVDSPTPIVALAGITTSAWALGAFPWAGSRGPSPTTKGVTGDPFAVQVVWAAWASAWTCAIWHALWLCGTVTEQHSWETLPAASRATTTIR
jgi:hypothetical protein